ncbi:hypothetical protein BDC45DRAFT_518171 [Circinella umbellata]|nr:hypothetical protein BDC45DRAFT_518171 [Circinella umbellata]
MYKQEESNTNNNNNNHPDPFAGQYPPPPPAPESYISGPSTGTPPAVNLFSEVRTEVRTNDSSPYYPPTQQHQETITQDQQQQNPWPITSAYNHPSRQAEYFSPPHIHYDQHRASYDHSAPVVSMNYKNDPHHRGSYDHSAPATVPMLYDHRPSYDQRPYEPAYTSSYQNQANDPSTYYPHPNTNYYTEELDAPSSPNTPIIPKTEPTSSSGTAVTAENQNNNNNQQTSSDQQKEKKGKKQGAGFGLFKKKKVESTPPQEQPILSGPKPAPVDEKPSYQRPAHDPEDGRGLRNACCCYNPALTCCSFFWMLFSAAILAGGVAMMIASKVVQDRCNNECGGGADETIGSCTVLCNEVLHQALLWGGLAIMVLASISVIWRLFTWCCAGCARNK